MLMEGIYKTHTKKVKRGIPFEQFKAKCALKKRGQPVEEVNTTKKKALSNGKHI